MNSEYILADGAADQIPNRKRSLSWDQSLEYHCSVSGVRAETRSSVESGDFIVPFHPNPREG